jgi:pimeloyl-ACP methyl ester carboxylesterase
MTDTVRSSDGTAIAFDRSGDGPVVILVAGAMSTRSDAVELASLLAGSLTVIAYDRRGRGDSGDTLPYAVEREIEDIEALIVAVGGSASLFGHSSGAVLALRAAATGLDIPRLAMYEPPFIVDDSHAPQPEDYVEHLDELLAAGRRGDAVAYFMTDSVGMPAEAVAEMRKNPWWAGMEAVGPTLPYDGRIMADTMRGDPAPLRQWASVAAPALVMDGGASYPFMHAAADAIAAVLPNSERQTLAGQDHGPASEILAPVLIEFFAR